MKISRLKYLLVFTLSYLGLLWERLWNRLWLTASLALFFIAFSLLNLPVLFGTVWHLIILGSTAALLATAFLYSKPPFSLPSRADVERHMEEISTLPHRPLEALSDKPVEGLSAEALGLWQKHLQRAARYIDHLRIYTPRPDVAAHDRWALRYAAVIFLAVGLVVAQGEAPKRLRQALTPDVGSLLTQKTAALDLWIVPPEYTHQTTTFLATARQGLVAHENTLQVPAGSILKLRLTGYRYAPRLRYAGQSYQVTEAAPQSFTFEMPLQHSGQLSLGSWFTRLGEWPITVLPDTAPEISIVQTEATPRSAVKITYRAQDDHDITKLTGTIAAAPDMADKLGLETYSFDIPPSNAGEPVSHVEDLAAHPWAGMPVILTLAAEDSTGHRSTSAAHAFVLPERTFTNPLAKRIIEERKSLLWDKNPLIRHVIADNLAAIANQPGLYKGNIVTFMSLSTAAKRLVYDGSDAAAGSVQELLWHVALKLEDGGLSLAQQELRDALQKMSQALNNKNTTKEQLQDVMDEVQQKMRQYVMTLAQEMQQRLREGKKVPVLSPELAQKFIKSMDLGKLLEQMQQLTQANSREDLQKMLDNLKNSLDNFDMKKFDQMQEKQMQAMKALQDLQEIIYRQQALLDKTNKTADPSGLPGQKKEQSAIREKLGETLREFGEAAGSIPDNFVKADQAMKLSEDALGKKRPQESLPQQKTALDEMQKGLDDTLKKIAKAMQQSILSFGLPQDGGNEGAGYDPLGRPNGTADDHSVKIPDEKERRRVQEIIQELRHRSNEPNRSKVERDYIDRLLDQF